jgi:hypothetical protein
MEVWVVGKLLSRDQRHWEFCGVFSSEQRALEACTTGQHFLGPATLDQRLPDETGEWPGAYYPERPGGDLPAATPATT